MQKFFIYLFLTSLILCSESFAQDTVRVSLSDFVEQGLDRSGQTSYQETAVDLAKNRIDEAENRRILPNLNFSTQHGVIPGVVSNRDDLSPNEYYLDPNLSNDWEDWAIFTRAEIDAAQPIFTWGAISKAIQAAEAGARAAEFEFEAQKKETEILLFELYYSYLLAMEMSRILDDANSKIRQVEGELNEMQEEGDSDLELADIFQFDIFIAEFEVQRTEVQQSLDYVERVWNYAMGGSQNTVYIPEEDFLKSVPFELESFSFYQERALESRAELQGAESGIEAMKHSVEAAKTQYYPSLFLGLRGSYANTPNRPRQSNPFIINNSNYASAAVGVSIRQNLNFLSTRTQVERAQIEYKRVRNLKEALTDGIILELNERYREAVVAEKRVTQLEEVLSISRNWVRQEELDYDFGLGDVNNLIDSIQKELETRVELQQNVFDLNNKIATLYKAAGIPITQLSLN